MRIHHPLLTQLFQLWPRMPRSSFLSHYIVPSLLHRLSEYFVITFLFHHFSECLCEFFILSLYSFIIIYNYFITFPIVSIISFIQSSCYFITIYNYFITFPSVSISSSIVSSCPFLMSSATHVLI